ncbi:MAG TPA: hypothetical protein VFX30_08190 [bacterium]|nr:hypothetical protein [bacterium]
MSVRDTSLFRPVSVEEYNRGVPSSSRVADRNGNGLVDEEDDFGGADPNYRLHRMCMERLPYAADGGDRLGLTLFDGRAGTYFMDVRVDERAERIMKRFRRGSPDLFDFGRTPDLGLHLFMGRGDHGRWIEALRRGAATLDDLRRSAILVEGGFDRKNDGCSFNTVLKIEGGRIFRRNVLKVTFRNAAGDHRELWNLRTGRIRVMR